MPTMPFEALQATAPASEGLSATSTSATAVLPEVADGAPTARTIASAASVPPDPPGQVSCASLTWKMSMWSPSVRPRGTWPSLSASPSTAFPATGVPLVATISLVSRVPCGMALTV